MSTLGLLKYVSTLGPVKCVCGTLAGTALVLSAQAAQAARASFSGDDTLDDVTVSLDGEQQSFTILRDAQRASQYYYVPNEPHLFEHIVNGKARPEFLLVRYQANKPGSPEDFQEAGLMQFAVRLSLPAKDLEALRQALIKRVGNSDGPITLSALRLKSAIVNLYDDDGTLIGKETKKDIVAPTFASQKMAFQVPLTKLGADVYDALVNGQTGVYVNFKLTYEGLTPPVGVSCNINWDKAYSLYSKDQHFAAEASYLGILNAKGKVDKQKIRDRLQTEKVVQCKSISDGKYDAGAAADKIIEYVNSNLIKDFEPPTSIKGLGAGKSTSKGSSALKGVTTDVKKLFGFGGNASYSVDLKDIKEIRKVSATYDMSHQTVETRITSVSGFVGVGSYPKEVREAAVVDVQSGEWPKALFGLPSISEESRLTRVDYQVQLNTTPPQSQVAVWQPGKGWSDLRGRPRNSLAFGLLGVSKAHASQLRFNETLQLSLPRDSLVINDARAVVNEVNGTPLPIANPLTPVDVVTIYGSDLSFARLDPDSVLLAVHVTLKSGERSYSATMRPVRKDGTYVEPDPVIWLVAKGVPVKAEVEFVRSDQADPIKLNGGTINLRNSASLDLELRDLDWRTP